MTETEWHECISPELMLDHLGERASLRKRRLFACACVRRIWSLLDQDRLRQVVKLAERFADGKASAKAVHKARRVTQWRREEREAEERRQKTWMLRAVRAAAQAVEALLQEEEPILSTPRDIRDAPDVISATRIARTAARAAEALVEVDAAASVEPIRRLDTFDAVELVREIFGNPFPASAIDARWLDWNGNTIPRMAKVIYRKRCFRNLPILADALEEAGCNDSAILTHCRAPQDHARGCWVVDLLLGME